MDMSTKTNYRRGAKTTPLNPAIVIGSQIAYGPAAKASRPAIYDENGRGYLWKIFGSARSKKKTGLLSWFIGA